MKPSDPATLEIVCPPRATLLDFDRGRLDETTEAEVSTHLTVCAHCEQVLANLQGTSSHDPLIALLKRSLEGYPLPLAPNQETWEYAPSYAIPRSEATEHAMGPVGPGLGGSPGALFRGRIGSHELLGSIGQGGMGVVYKARHISLQREVALKMILGGHHAPSRNVARFLREGKAVARLRHANVVQVYEYDTWEGLPYLTMELIEGGSLHARLAKGPLPCREAADVVRTLAQAVEYAHEQGVIHRDLKPANILLTTDGTPKITDFGLAKLLDQDSDPQAMATLTVTDSVLGTPSYMAPEQAEGRLSEIGKRTDVYALGAILYATLTGRPPFSSETKVKTIDLVRSKPPEPPSKQRPEVPRWLEAVCLKCLEKAPNAGTSRPRPWPTTSIDGSVMRSRKESRAV